MRDYKRRFRRLCLVMGLAAAPLVSSCSDSDANSVADAATRILTDADGVLDITAPGDSTTGDDVLTVGDSGITIDGDYGPDIVDRISDVTARADTSVSDVESPTDTGPGPTDAAPVEPDVEGPQDIGVEEDVELSDVHSSDIAAVDVTVLDDVNAVTPNACEDEGVTGTVSCFTAEEIQFTIDNPPFGGKPGADYLLPPEGCPSGELVLDGCCNPATGAPVLVGDECCYTYCMTGCCGRPFMVEGGQRVAQSMASSAWTPAPEAAPIEIPVDAREALATAWRADALDEHASVASFLRFGMELLHLGAPPDLVSDATAAAQDEVRHAQLASGVAARFDGRTDGPGALDCGDATIRTDWATIVRACIFEGCVGETLAAALVGAAAREATDPSLRNVLTLIAADEGRHSELAWRMVAWSWREGGDAIRAVIRQAFEEVRVLPVEGDPREAMLAGVPDAIRRMGGRLGAEHARRVNAETMRQVILPCAEALLAST